MPRITSSLTIDPCLRRNEGHSILSHPRTPDSSCGPRFLPGGPPLLVPTTWDNLECLGNQERLGLPTGSGMERKGRTQTSQTRQMGQGLVARGRGWGSAEVPGSWRGRESGKARTDRHNCTSRSGETRERAMLGASSPFSLCFLTPTLPLPSGSSCRRCVCGCPTRYQYPKWAWEVTCCYTPHHHPKEGTVPLQGADMTSPLSLPSSAHSGVLPGTQCHTDLETVMDLPRAWRVQQTSGL